MLDIIKAYAVKNLCYLAKKSMVPCGVVVHSTGANNPSLKRYVDCPDQVGINQYGNHWNTAKPGGRKVCVHAFIGYDKDKNIRVAEILPLDICCWGVGKGNKGSYNFSPSYIQFEICEDGLKDEEYYQKVFDVAVQYTAHLCQLYNIPIENVVGHKEAHVKGYGSNHGDPEHWMKKFGDTMDDFRSRVEKLVKGNPTIAEFGEDSATPAPTPDSQIKDGALVSISEDAVYYSGKPVPKWVNSQRWYVKGNTDTDRIVIDKNEAGTNSICSPIHRKYVTVVKAATTESMVDASATGCPYLVRITERTLNIRKGAGTNTSKVGVITDGGIYTIVEEKQGKGASMWGKLKSGAGWIALDYTEKLQ